MTTAAPADTTPAPADPARPPSWLGRFGTAVSVGLTAIATAFAGLSTSELQQAMLWRTAAGQDQAKATDQWTLAGFKRTRAQVAHFAASQFWVEGDGADPLRDVPADDPGRAAAKEWLAGRGPPPAKMPPVADDRVADLIARIRERTPERELLATAAGVTLAAVDAEIQAGEAAVAAYDLGLTPTLAAADALVERYARTRSPTAVALRQARFELDARRYSTDAQLNQDLSLRYEARVRVTTAASDRHRVRSQNFFYAMLAAQAGATLSAFAMARHRFSVVWLLAGFAGAVAVGFGSYVYLTM